MNKKVFIEKLAQVTGVKKSEVDKIYDALPVVVVDAIKSGEEVILQDFCTFKPYRRSARVGINPKTGEKVNIASSLSIKFKMSNKVKKALN